MSESWADTVSRYRRRARHSNGRLHWRMPARVVPVGLGGGASRGYLSFSARLDLPPDVLPEAQNYRFTPSRQAQMMEWLQQLHSTVPGTFVPCTQYVMPPSSAALAVAEVRGSFGVTSEHHMLSIVWAARHSVEANRGGGCDCEHPLT